MPSWHHFALDGICERDEHGRWRSITMLPHLPEPGQELAAMRWIHTDAPDDPDAPLDRLTLEQVLDLLPERHHDWAIDLQRGRIAQYDGSEVAEALTAQLDIVETTRIR